MKKTTYILAVMLLFGFWAATVSAATFNPGDDVGQCSKCTVIDPDDPDFVGDIARGCEGDQEQSGVFDFEDYGRCGEGEKWDVDSYCQKGKLGVHRALFEMCRCTKEGVWDEFPGPGDTIDISMEIIVQKADGTYYDGDNGVYWAQNIDTIGVELDPDENKLCAMGKCLPDEFNFKGGKEWVYFDANGDEVDVNSYKAVKFQPYWPTAAEAAANPSWLDHGLSFPTDSKFIGSDIWAWADVPWMIVDPAKVERGDRVFVRICMYHNATTQEELAYCGDCCCLIPIGDLCCDPTTVEYGGGIIYPYLVAMNNPDWWYGVTVTNVSGMDGDVTMLYYENDGDKAEATVTIPANYTKIFGITDLMSALTLTTGGTLGDSAGYMEVQSDEIAISGFAIIVKKNGESMGYIPIPAGDTGRAD